MSVASAFGSRFLQALSTRGRRSSSGHSAAAENASIASIEKMKTKEYAGMEPHGTEPVILLKSSNDHQPRNVSRRAAAWTLFVLIAISGSSYVDRGVLSIVAQPLARDLRLSDSELGLLGGLAFAIFFALFALPIARIAERRSRTSVIAACLVIWSIMTALCGFAGHFWQLFILRMGVGVGEGGCSPAIMSLLSDQHPQRRRATIFALVGAGAAFGTMIGFAFAGWVAQHHGWRAAFISVGVPGLLLGLIFLMTVEEPRRGSFDESSEHDTKAPGLRIVARTLLGKKAYWHVAAGFTLASFAGNGIMLFLSPFLVRQFGLSLSQMGLAIGVVQGVAAVFGTAGIGILAGRLANKDKRWFGWMPALAMLFAAPAFMLAFHQASWLVAMGLVALATTFGLSHVSPSFSVSQGIVPSRMRATAAAIMMIGSNLIGAGGGPVFMGWASDVLATREFGAGNYLEVCGRQDNAALVAEACASASRAGLQTALSVCALVYVWSAIHYLLAVRTLRRDFAAESGR